MRAGLRYAITTVLAAALVSLGGTAFADHDELQTVRVEVPRAVVFGDVLLAPGMYEITHDDVKKASGEACLSIWRIKDGKRVELAASFCIREPREGTALAKVSTRRVSPNGPTRITEVQFAGDAFGHRLDVDR